MIVSGGKILATAKVKTDGITVSGDGLTEPIGIKDVQSKAISYDVIEQSKNVHISKDEDTEANKITFGVSVDETIYSGSDYVSISEDRVISINQDLVESATFGKNAYETIEANKTEWGKDTTYTAGDNISIDEHNVISGRDWTGELSTKVDSEDFDKVKSAVDEISGTVKDHETRFKTVEDVLIEQGEAVSKLEQSAVSVRTYIYDNEKYWLNKEYEVVTSTPDTMSISSSYDEENRKTTFTVSANGRTYTAGDWIDGSQLEEGKISVSGYKALKTQAPLYFSADPADENTMWILYDTEGSSKKTNRAIVICNGWDGDPDSYYSNNEGIIATVPSKSLDAEYVFHLSRAMAVQININAKFVARTDATDKIGIVGFDAATVEGTKTTNRIEYSMFGSQGEQYFAASTIARLDANAFGGIFPSSGVDISFKFIYDSDFLTDIQYPCISLYELGGEI